MSACLEKLREQEELIAQLHAQIAQLVDDAEAALLTDGEADMRIMELEGETGTLRKELAAREVRELLVNERVKKLEEEVRRADAHVEILRKQSERTDDEVRRKAGEHPELSARVGELEEALKKAEEEAEEGRRSLQARAAASELETTVLQREKDEMQHQLDMKVKEAEEGRQQFETRLSEREAENVELQRKVGDLQQQLQQKIKLEDGDTRQQQLDALMDRCDELDTDNALLQDKLVLAAGVETRLRDLLASHNPDAHDIVSRCNSLRLRAYKLTRPLYFFFQSLTPVTSQSVLPDLYVCRYVTEGEPCHGLFTSPAVSPVGVFLRGNF